MTPVTHAAGQSWATGAMTPGHADETGLHGRRSQTEHCAPTQGLPDGYLVESARPGPTQQAGSLGLGQALHSRGLGGSPVTCSPPCPTSPEPRVPGPSPAWALWTRIVVTPTPPQLHQHTNPALCWELGRTGHLGLGRGWPQDCHPQEL